MTSFSHSWNIPVEQDPSFNMLRLQPLQLGTAVVQAAPMVSLARLRIQVLVLLGVIAVRVIDGQRVQRPGTLRVHVALARSIKAAQATKMAPVMTVLLGSAPIPTNLAALQIRNKVV